MYAGLRKKTGPEQFLKKKTGFRSSLQQLSDISNITIRQKMTENEQDREKRKKKKRQNVKGFVSINKQNTFVD